MTTTSIPSVVVVLGSATPPGRLHRAVDEAAGRLDGGGTATVTVVDLAARAIAWADGRPADALGDDTAATIAEIAAADAVVLASPVYRGSVTGVLKNLLDHLPVAALRDTPTGIAAMGASDHHYLGVERHLRDILAFFGAVVAPTAAYLTSADFADGAPGPRAAAQLDGLLATVVTLAARLGDAPSLAPAPLAAAPRT